MQLKAEMPARGALAKPCRVQQRLSHVAPVRAVKVEKEAKKKQAEEDQDEHEVSPSTQEVKNLLTGVSAVGAAQHHTILYYVVPACLHDVECTWFDNVGCISCIDLMWHV